MQLVASGKLRLPSCAGVQPGGVRNLVVIRLRPVGVRLCLPALLIVIRANLTLFARQIRDVLVIIVLQLRLVRRQLLLIHSPDIFRLVRRRRGLLPLHLLQLIYVVLNLLVIGAPSAGGAVYHRAGTGAARCAPVLLRRRRCPADTADTSRAAKAAKAACQQVSKLDLQLVPIVICVGVSVRAEIPSGPV